MKVAAGPKRLNEDEVLQWVTTTINQNRKLADAIAPKPRHWTEAFARILNTVGIPDTQCWANQQRLVEDETPGAISILRYHVSEAFIRDLTTMVANWSHVPQVRDESSEPCEMWGSW
jgi:hypothetical protein